MHSSKNLLPDLALSAPDGTDLVLRIAGDRIELKIGQEDTMIQFGVRETRPMADWMMQAAAAIEEGTMRPLDMAAVQAARLRLMPKLVNTEGCVALATVLADSARAHGARGAVVAVSIDGADGHSDYGVAGRGPCLDMEGLGCRIKDWLGHLWSRAVSPPVYTPGGYLSNFDSTTGGAGGQPKHQGTLGASSGITGLGVAAGSETPGGGAGPTQGSG